MVQACRDALLGLALDRAANAGLILSSYLKQQRVANGGNEGTDREDLLKAAIAACGQAADVYSRAFARWEAALAAAAVGATVEMDGRAVMGLGGESPLETGLTLHHTYGTPILPGSALKGLAAHYCNSVWGAADKRFRGPDGEYFTALFGTVDDGGHIVFHDAWVRPESLVGSLEVDVMTVHHPGYYQRADAPTDFDDPTPIPFLAIKGKFQVFVQCDVPTEEGRRWARLALTLLRQALEDWGIGGKTNAGYGRILPPDARPAMAGAAPAAQRTLSLQPRQRVQAVLSAEKTKKGGWKADCEVDGIKVSGHIVNTQDVPPDRKPGDRVTLEVNSVSGTQVAFSWPKA